MVRSSMQLGFPRRVVALYLLFCLGSILLLATGGVLAIESLLKSQATGDALSQVGRVAAAAQIDRLTTGGQKLQSIVEKARAEGHLAWCAVIDAEGRFVAHSDPELVGALQVEPVGSQLRWGEVDGVRYRNEHNRLVSEYRAPLEVDDRPAGALVMAVVVPGWETVVRELAHHAPLAIVAPLALIVVGGWWLRRAARPLGGVEAELARVACLPIDLAPSCRAVPPQSLAAIGWNRLVDHLSSVSLPTESSQGETHLARLAVAAGANRSRDVLESLCEGVAVTDAEGRLDFANRAVAALLGRDELSEGETLSAVLEEVAPEGAAKLGDASSEAELVSEVVLTGAAGERTLRLARAPLAGDAAGGHVWTFRDVTQQKLAEASRDQFIDTATHELRTPLANIKAYAETLAMGELVDVEQQKEFCNTINTEATRLARFVDDLLSISSIEVGTLGVQRQNVDVRRLLEEAADKVRPLMKQKALRFEASLSEKLGEARLDKDKVAGMVVNLLGNAAKYTPTGGSVTLAAVRQDDCLKIEVRDTGVGIAEEEQERVFEKFFRSANPEVRDEVGTGLGLPLAREIARLHRGDLTLVSKLGEGSTFTANLPLQ